MPDSLLLLASLTAPVTPPPLPPGYTLRPPTPDDVPALAALYFAAYPPGVACATLTEAQEDIRATFAGAYGDLWLDASALIEHHDPTSTATPTLAAAILTVHCAPWEGTPACSFIIELFTAPPLRRLGLARTALIHARNAALASGATAIALRVSADNTPAIALYRTLGFAVWPSSTT
jgi:ribosomal protein S18 acetylase RimI-like enzyme